ncbi:MAG TPA: transposase, partial [Chloroflexota bacterium]|nr:transposase [Chloroflexota bacterium]
MPRAATPPAHAQKKHLVASEQDAKHRAAWRDQLTEVPAEQVVFADERGATIMLTPAYGRAPRGHRCVGRVVRNWGLRTTLLAAVTMEGSTARSVVDGATDRSIFDTYVDQVVVPTLRPGQVVVWDTLSAHKRVHARAAIEAAGCRVGFLPADSPDFHPIEPAFSKPQAGLRRAGDHEARRGDMRARAGAITPHLRCPEHPRARAGYNRAARRSLYPHLPGLLGRPSRIVSVAVAGGDDLPEDRPDCRPVAVNVFADLHANT